jgi:hypothetical protein
MSSSTSKILKKFDVLRQRQKPLYKKAYDFIKATTAALTVRFLSLSNFFMLRKPLKMLVRRHTLAASLK